MRIAILTAGSRGDVEPYVALGEGLAKAGYRVALATHEGFSELVRGRGLEYREFRGNPRELLESAMARRVVESGERPVAFLRELFRLAREFTPGFLSEIKEALWDADLIVFSGLGIPAYHVAEAKKVPAVAAFLQPLLPTRSFPYPFGPPSPLSRFGWYNLASHLLTALASWRMVARETNRWRQEELGLPPMSTREALERLRKLPLVLLGYSPKVVPPPSDWPPNAITTGYWRLSTSPGWNPPRHLLDFLSQHTEVAYVGFGSMRGPDPAGLTRAVVGALRRCRMPAVISRGWGGLAPEEGEDILLIDEVPHSWLFPRVSLLVHHGGAGTTAAGLLAGRPAVTVPFIADQFFWGERVWRLGAGTRPIPARSLTEDRLHQALCRARNDPSLHAGARDLARELNREDGVAAAVAAIERVALSGRV